MNANRALLVLAISFCATLSPAAQPPSHPIASVSRSNILARTGGLIQAPIAGPAILFLNTQNRIPAAALSDISAQIQNFLQLPCPFSTRPPAEPFADAAKALADTNTAAVIVICDSAGQPSLLVAPESRWAVVNVAALGGPGVSDAKLAERVQKELWRAFAYLMGAANSNFEHCLLKPVLSPADLDLLECKTICPEPFVKILSQAQKMGVRPIRVTSYRKAVEAGWAPPPTNDFQRAIWEEIKKTPAK